MEELNEQNQIENEANDIPSAVPDRPKRDSGIDYFVLKTLAFASLTSYVFAFSGIITIKPLVIILGIIGYASLPLFAFCSVESYKHSQKLNSLIIRNIIFALLCAFPYRFAFYSKKNLSDVRSYFSLELTCLLCIGAVMFYDRMKNKTQKMFCVAFMCAISLFIGTEFAPYMPIITFVLFIYIKEQEGKDEAGFANGDKDRIAAVNRRKYLLSQYTFTKVAFFIVTLSIIIPIVSVLFSRFVPGYSETYQDELLRNYCMPGMLLSLPAIRFYNGEKGIENRLTKVVFRGYYLLLLVLVVMIKIFFLYDYSILPVSG